MEAHVSSSSSVSSARVRRQLCRRPPVGPAGRDSLLAAVAAVTEDNALSELDDWRDAMDIDAAFSSDLLPLDAESEEEDDNPLNRAFWEEDDAAASDQMNSSFSSLWPSEDEDAALDFGAARERTPLPHYPGLALRAPAPLLTASDSRVRPVGHL